MFNKYPQQKLQRNNSIYSRKSIKNEDAQGNEERTPARRNSNTLLSVNVNAALLGKRQSIHTQNLDQLSNFHSQQKAGPVMRQGSLTLHGNPGAGGGSPLLKESEGSGNKASKSMRLIDFDEVGHEFPDQDAGS